MTHSKIYVGLFHNHFQCDRYTRAHQFRELIVEVCYAVSEDGVFQDLTYY